MAENGTQKELSAQQHRGLAALLASKNVREAAQASGIAERTLWRWLQDARFVAALSAAEGQAIDAATRRLVGMTDTSLSVLHAILTDDAAPMSLRARVGIAVLDQLVKLRELRNVEARLAALEASVYEHD